MGSFGYDRQPVRLRQRSLFFADTHSGISGVKQMSKPICNHPIQRMILPMLAAFILFSCFCSAPAGAAQASPDIRTWAGLQEAIDAAESGDTITLTADLTAGEHDSRLRIPDGLILTLDLNGCTVDRALTEHRGNAGVAVFVHPGAILTVADSSAEGSGKITGGYATHGGGINNTGTVILTGGSITGNRAEDSGGGIANYGSLVIEGGTVTGNTSLTEGGGILNTAKAYMTLDTAAVSGNSAPKHTDILNYGSMKTIGGKTVDFAAVRSALDLVTVLPATVLVIVLFCAIYLDNYLKKEQKKIMYLISVLVFTLILQNYLDTWVYLAGKPILFRTAVSVYGYAVRPAILALFLSIIRPDRQYRLVWAGVGINAAVYLTAFFSPLAFSFSSYGHFLPGPLNPCCLILSALLLLYCFYLTFREFRPKTKKETWIPVFVLLLICLAVVLDDTLEYNELSVSFLTIAVTIGCIMYYIWLHLQFVREHERALRAEHRIQIMMTQIQPHFLFNTLSAIRALCIKDPETAVRTIGLFSTYLRRNLESLDQAELIPLAKELEHTRVYTEIETIRFPHIRIVYDIRDEACSVPALTIQPLVENAIRYGARSREEGIVKIIAFREDHAHLIVIEDNGIGFDPQAVKSTGGTHIGIRNVRERLAQMCGGTMEIRSKQNEGTKIIIRIPAQKE